MHHLERELWWRHARDIVLMTSCKRHCADDVMQETLCWWRHAKDIVLMTSRKRHCACVWHSFWLVKSRVRREDQDFKTKRVDKKYFLTSPSYIMIMFLFRLTKPQIMSFSASNVWPHSSTYIMTILSKRGWLWNRHKFHPRTSGKENITRLADQHIIG